MVVNYYIIGMVVGAILLLAIVIWFLLRVIKKRKKEKQTIAGIPDDILSDFVEAEKRIKGGEADGNPYQILWEVARERNRNFQEARPDTTTGQIQSPGVGETIDNSKPTDGNLQGDREPEQGRSIQIQSDIEHAKDKRNPKRNWAKFE